MFFDGYDSPVIASEPVPESCTARYHNVSDFEAVEILTKCAQDNFGTNSPDNDVTTGPPTNIHWMYTLYKHKFATEDNNARFGLLIKDGNYADAGNEHSSEARRRSSYAIVKMKQALKSYFLLLQESHPDVRLSITTVQFDLFGFGRGAATARHFAARLHSRDAAITQVIHEVFGNVTLMPGCVRFMGIFDSVVLADMRQKSDSPAHGFTGGEETLLPRDVAAHVFHITATHEWRFNYALDSIKPYWPELALPGSHSDIGGGYLPVVTETHFLSRPVTTIDEDNLTVKERVPVLASCLPPLMRASKISYEYWYTRPDDASGDDTLPVHTFSALSVRNRVVKNGWSKVALRVMIDAASEAGIELENVRNYKELSLPDELKPLSDKALRMGKDIRSGRVPETFSADEHHLLESHYVHCSANWNATIAGRTGFQRSASDIISFVNRPDEYWQRTIFSTGYV